MNCAQPRTIPQCVVIARRALERENAALRQKAAELADQLADLEGVPYIIRAYRPALPTLEPLP